ncbi:hypothetical protein N7452_003101 [Penicillium brevicompactum]|uniref:Uncharacterized protein n=1 Tax=Penicillium brevicompactum TaxID=5074 RepID=A0A9W9UJP1_PENBR|nr:hypothetical protein N7452_003101 [Penicillium brevicompactum]
MRESRAEPEANKATENKNRDQRPGIPRDSRVEKQSLDDYATWGRPMVRKALDDVMAEISKSRPHTFQFGTNASESARPVGIQKDR